MPIALYVNRKTGEYLRDPAVNARIVAALEAGGADVWFTADHQALLGPDHDLADYEPQNDILDVWFDSGSTHAFVMRSVSPARGPASISKDRTSIAAGSSPRCWNPAAHVAARPMMPC